MLRFLNFLPSVTDFAMVVNERSNCAFVVAVGLSFGVVRVQPLETRKRPRMDDVTLDYIINGANTKNSEAVNILSWLHIQIK